MGHQGRGTCAGTHHIRGDIRSVDMSGTAQHPPAEPMTTGQWRDLESLERMAFLQPQDAKALVWTMALSDPGGTAGESKRRTEGE